jgi:hypothetical protein
MLAVSASRLGFTSGLTLIVALSFSTNLAVAQEPSPKLVPSALEREPGGWTDLLAEAGPGLKGWVRGPIPPPPKGKLGENSQWKLDASTGHLICEGNGGHDWLRWDKELGDAIFHVEWRYTPLAGKKGYNSGIYARNSADGTIWHQAQIGDRSGGYLFGESPGDGGKLRRMNTSGQGPSNMVKAAGEWNTTEITSKGKDMTVWTNGAETAAWHDCRAPRGYVGLEAERWKIEFRNVKVKPLDDRKEVEK